MAAWQAERRPFYDLAGPTSARAIVFIHGAAWTRAEWLAKMQTLADEFRALALDLPGHGARAAEPFRLDGAIHAVMEAIEQAGVGHTLLVGHSLGGYVAMAHAAAHPEQAAGLVLSGSSVDYRLLGLVSSLDASLSLSVVGERRILAMQEKTVRGTLPPELAEAQIAAGFSFGALPAVYRELARHDFRAMLRSYPGPTLILNGARDRPNRRGERKLLTACQHGRLAIIAGAGHACNLEQPDAFSAEVRAMAERLADPR